MNNQESYIEWWINTQEPGINEIEDFFSTLFSVHTIPNVYKPILYTFVKNSQIKNWDREIFDYSSNIIIELEKKLGTGVVIDTLILNLDYFISIYVNLLDLESRIDLMNIYTGTEEDKAKIFSVGIFNDTLNKPFNNCLKLLIEFFSVIEGKSKYQKNLGPQLEFLSSPKRGFNKITELAGEPGIRNAMSHDGVRFDGSQIFFSYNKGQELFQEEMSVYEFKYSLMTLFDGTSAILLSWIGYLCSNKIDYNLLTSAKNSDLVQLFFEKLSFSTLLIKCEKIEEVIINKENDTKVQANMEFSSPDLDLDSRMFFGILSAKKLFIKRKLSKQDSVMISFKSPKTLISFFRIQGTLLEELNNGNITIEDATKCVIQSNDIMMSQKNSEDRDEKADKFMKYSDIENDDYRIVEIEDISIGEMKRFKAVAYLKRAKRKTHVIESVNEIVDQLKSMNNYGFATNSTKHGSVEADILYIPIYKKEFPRNKGRELMPNNDNFIVLVQYDLNKQFPIHNNIIDSVLKKRVEANLEYKWNPNF